jgi:hypothetical protein
LRKTLSELETLNETLFQNDYPAKLEFEDTVIQPVKSSITFLEYRKKLDIIDSLWAPLSSWWFWLITAYVGLPFSVWLVRPLLILWLNDVLQQVNIPLPPVLEKWLKITLLYSLFVKPYAYSRRVLNAWVRKQLPAVREAFTSKPTVQQRSVHVSVPARLGGEVVMDLSPGRLRPLFQEKRGCLLIHAEGGSGKTSLACLIGRWAMASEAELRLCSYPILPVLIEQDFLTDDKGQPSLVQTIRGQLQALIEADEHISDELLDKLLRRGRILVILDHLSEMGKPTRDAFHPGRPDFPVQALLVTSRTEEPLDGVGRTTLVPMRIRGNRLSSFLEAYLGQRGKRDLFNDPEFFAACGGLSDLVGEREVTVLLAKLYADLMITYRERATGEDLPQCIPAPQNIPALMLDYLRELNRSIPVDERRDDALILCEAKAIAWVCLEDSFRPGAAPRNEVIRAIKEADQEKREEDSVERKTRAQRQEEGESAEDTTPAISDTEAEGRLDYLETRLRVLETLRPAGGEKVRFMLDPVAEYLAGLYLAEKYGGVTRQWRSFLARADKKEGAPEAIKGFLQAIRDCCRALQVDLTIPAFILEELGSRIGVAHDEARAGIPSLGKSGKG